MDSFGVIMVIAGLVVVGLAAKWLIESAQQRKRRRADDGCEGIARREPFGLASGSPSALVCRPRQTSSWPSLGRGVVSAGRLIDEARERAAVNDYL
jgi:hypothetical protein